MLENHKNKYKNYLFSVNEVKRKRKRGIIKWTIVAAATFILGYLGLKFSKVISPSTITSDIIIGLICTALGHIVALVYATLKNDIKKITFERKEKFVKNEKS